jgi:hypothetical protein
MKDEFRKLEIEGAHMQSERIRETKSAHEPYALMLSACRSVANDDRTAHNTRDPTVENLRRARLATRRLGQLDGPHLNHTETLILHAHRSRSVLQSIPTPPQLNSHRGFSPPPPAATTTQLPFPQQ